MSIKYYKYRILVQLGDLTDAERQIMNNLRDEVINDMQNNDPEMSVNDDDIITSGIVSCFKSYSSGTRWSICYPVDSIDFSVVTIENIPTGGIYCDMFVESSNANAEDYNITSDDQQQIYYVKGNTVWQRCEDMTCLVSRDDISLH